MRMKVGRRDGGRNSWSVKERAETCDGGGVVSCSEHLHAFPLGHSTAGFVCFFLLFPSHSELIL